VGYHPAQGALEMTNTTANTATQRLWAADPHQYGPGKVHIVDSSDESKTMCGRFVAAIPGRSASARQATCRICLDAVMRRPENERRREEYEKLRIERETQRAEENEKWHSWYESYLKTPEWAHRQRKVLERSRGICEGCLVNRATQVHHVTYAHVGEEFLWELRAICRPCHERLHRIERERRDGSQ
jgi:hypothetical protein